MKPHQYLPDGIYAASVTPLDADGRIAGSKLAAHVSWLLHSGCNGVALMGTTGEATSFSVAERMEALEAVVGAGVPPERLIVGTGCCAIPDTVTLTRHACTAGCGGVLMLPPFYYKGISDDGLLATIDRVVQAVGDPGLRIILYHIPALTGVSFDSDLIGRLISAYPGIVTGIKDSSGNLERMRSVAAHFPGFRVFSGTERYLFDMTQAGGAGCITATANVTCTLAAQVLTCPDTLRARMLQQRLTDVRTAIEDFPMVPALKSVLSRSARDAGWSRLRPPLVSLSDQQADDLRKALAGVGFVPPPHP